MSSSGGNKQSIVWQFFNLTTDNKFVVCSLCKKQLKFFKNTTNLNKHLKRVHPSHLLLPPKVESNEEDEPSTPVASTSRALSPKSVFFQRPQASCSTASTSVEQTTFSAVPSTSRVPSPRSVPVERLQTSTATALTPTSSIIRRPQKQLRLFGSSRSNTHLTDTQIADFNVALLKMIVLDYQPLRIVEDTGFQQFVKKLNPLYTLPSRKILSSQLLPQLYESEASKLINKLSAVNHVAVTTDLWTSDSNTHYVTVTAHLNIDGTLHASALQTSEVKGSQTGPQIALELEDIFHKWNISEKIVTIVSDNGANIKCAINDHLQKHHHPCVAHTLNLCAKDSLNTNKTLSSILQKCRQIVGHFKHSALAVQKLNNMQQQMNTPQLKVKQDVATRWNSTYIMLQRLMEIKTPITAVMSSLQKAPEMLTAEEWLVIEDCVPLLKPLDLMTTVLSGEKYVTLSSIIPLVRGLQYLLFPNDLVVMKKIKYLQKPRFWILVIKNMDLVPRKMQIMQKNGS